MVGDGEKGGGDSTFPQTGFNIAYSSDNVEGGNPDTIGISRLMFCLDHKGSDWPRLMVVNNIIQLVPVATGRGPAIKKRHNRGKNKKRQQAPAEAPVVAVANLRVVGAAPAPAISEHTWLMGPIDPDACHGTLQRDIGHLLAGRDGFNAKDGSFVLSRRHDSCCARLVEGMLWWSRSGVHRSHPFDNDGGPARDGLKEAEMNQSRWAVVDSNENEKCLSSISSKRS
jgi:hypothetical protein